MNDPVKKLRSNNWYKHVHTSRLVKVYSAKVICEDGGSYWFKSSTGKIFFNRRCDLINSLNHAFGVTYCYEWQKLYGENVIIESRTIIG